MNLNKDEKVINKITNPIRILDQQKYVLCNITITNQRFLIERDGILKDFKLSELESFRYVKSMFDKTGIQLKLKNGFTYDLALTKPDSLLHKIEAITLSKTPESGEPIVNKAANALIYLCLSVILIPILYFSYNTYDNYRFNSDPIKYIENSSELSDNVKYRSNDLKGYPYLHGTWEYYDRNTDFTTRLLVMMYEDGEYKKGRYIIKERNDLDKNEGKDFFIRLQGEFNLKKGKNEYGVELLIAHDKKLFDFYYQFNNEYPFLIVPGGNPYPFVKIGPIAEKSILNFGGMKKISNRSFSIKSKSNSNAVKSNTSTNPSSKIRIPDEVEKVIPPPPPTPEIIKVVEDEEEIEETVIESTEIDEEETDENTPESKNIQLAIITDPNGTTNVRSGMGTNNPVIYKLKTNEIFNVYLNSNRWWLVELSNKQKGYIFYDRVSLIRNDLDGKYTKASNYFLNDSELNGLSKDDLKIMRNEIFARYGFIFQEGGKMNNYFKNEGWYKPKLNNVDSKLTQLEKYNIRLIKNYETGYD